MYKKIFSKEKASTCNTMTYHIMPVNGTMKASPEQNRVMQRHRLNVDS